MASVKKTEGDAGKPSPYWSKQVGLKPHTVTVFERQDKDLTVWLRWSPLGGHGGAPDKMSLRFKLRQSITERRDQTRQAEAIEKAQAAYNRLLKGEDPRTPEKPQDDNAATKTLTIADGLDRALRIPGMYPVENEHSRDMRRYSAHVCDHLPAGVQTFDDLSSTKYAALWQAIAHWRVKLGVRTRTGEIEGKRAAELAIVLLSQAGRWLHEDKQLKTLPAMPKKKWREQFVADWARITHDPVREPEPPRHTPEELGRLLAGIDAGLGDPRFRLAFLTAGEARLGQALRCDRSALDLSGQGAFGLGRFTVPHTGKKRGVVIDLTPELRAAWDEALTDGYLSDLEAAYRSGILRTYPLFPGKRLVRGVASIDAVHPIGKRGALDWFHDLERLSGVQVLEGRGWYGIRRVAADIAEDVEKDGRALNAITGHTSDETRRKIYQQKRRDAVLAKATEARAAARAVALEAAKASAGGVVVPPPAPRRSEHRAQKPRAPRRSPNYAARPCPTCGREFTPTGPNTKQCETCSPRRVRPPKPDAADPAEPVGAH